MPLSTGFFQVKVAVGLGRKVLSMPKFCSIVP